MRTLQTDLDALQALYTESVIDLPTYTVAMELAHLQWAQLHAASARTAEQDAWLAGFPERVRRHDLARVRRGRFTRTRHRR
jgi:hypothetical protein